MASRTRRLRSLHGALVGDAVPRVPDRGLERAIADVLSAGDASHIWLTLAVLRPRFPTRHEVVEVRRRLAIDSPLDVVRRIRPVGLGTLRGPDIEIVSGTVFVDVHHTARTGLATGIQRVVRKTIEHWSTRHDIVLVGWDTPMNATRELSDQERENALFGTRPHARKTSGVLTIPWRSTYILPELAIEPQRTARIAALAEFSGNRTAVIGYDCVPLTSAETVGAGMGGAFAKNLAAVAWMGRVAAISAAATTEYEGWRTMLSGAGLVGPDVCEIVLPIEAEDVSDEELRATEDAIVVPGMPLLLCVGSHEPRKNHLAVLQASEQLWRAGRDFALVFIGGNSWGSHEFQGELRRLQEDGRPVVSISAVTGELLWSAYRLAACTVFPSLNEGYGLPVAESLAVGTPVVTSDFGSMREIASSGGAVLVNPRDDDQIASAIESVLFDPTVADRLRREAAAVPRRDWAQYADELWAYFTSADLPSHL